MRSKFYEQTLLPSVTFTASPAERWKWLFQPVDTRLENFTNPSKINLAEKGHVKSPSQYPPFIPKVF